ncbi:hypothetical protein BGZ94_000266 [Podila epigama]|nr:hypothetical protein BGZ94_000266 [Podila epigama]
MAISPSRVCTAPRSWASVWASAWNGMAGGRASITSSPTALLTHFAMTSSIRSPASSPHTLVRTLRTRTLARKRPTGTIPLRQQIKEVAEMQGTVDINESTTSAPHRDTTTLPPTRKFVSRHVHKGFPPEAQSPRLTASWSISDSSSTSRFSSPSSPSIVRQPQGQQKKPLERSRSNLKAGTPTLKLAPSSSTESFLSELQAFPFVPAATSSELAKAHRFFFLPAEFVKSASHIDMIPNNTLIPEVAFIGRSNIGKSSLINGLVNRNGLVKTSSKPGHTQMMNFFKLGDKLSLVDMPGYGWKSRDEWGGMILEYLQTRKNLRRIYILVDPSHGLKESDQQIMKILDNSGLSYQVVLTKIDRLSKTRYRAAKAEIEATLVKDAICCFPQVLGVSSKDKNGLDDLRAAIVKAGQLTL